MQFLLHYRMPHSCSIIKFPNPSLSCTTHLLFPSPCRIYFVYNFRLKHDKISSKTTKLHIPWIFQTSRETSLLLSDTNQYFSQRMSYSLSSSLFFLRLLTLSPPLKFYIFHTFLLHMIYLVLEGMYYVPLIMQILPLYRELQLPSSAFWRKLVFRSLKR